MVRLATARAGAECEYVGKRECESTALLIAMAFGNRRGSSPRRTRSSPRSMRKRVSRLPPRNEADLPPPGHSAARLGREFAELAEALAKEVRALEAVQPVLCDISIDATAIGDGANVPIGYAQRYVTQFADISGLSTYLASNSIEARADTHSVVLYASCMRSLRISLSKVCSELRAMASPRSGRTACDCSVAEGAGRSGPVGPGESDSSRKAAARPSPAACSKHRRSSSTRSTCCGWNA